MSRKTRALSAALLAVLAILGGFELLSTSRYRVQLVMPSAAQLTTGSPVLIRGSAVGKVEELRVRGGRAVVTVTVSGEDAPLHDGTTTSVDWAAALGERTLTLHPGPRTNPAIPDGGLLDAPSRQAEVDQVLAALDQTTRARLTSLIRRLDTTVHGSEPELNATLRSAGPAVEALGQVASAIGKDGPAINQLVDELHRMTTVAVGRQQQLRGVVTDLTSFTGEAADKQQQLSDGLRELPSALATANDTLSRVPAATDATAPLLEELRPATGQLPELAGELNPLMRDLEPALDRLRPTLEATRDLFGRTPRLLDTAHDTLPVLGRIAHGYQPAARFLRPYTPEFVGFLTNWGSAFSTYDSQGHLWAGLLAPGSNAFDDNAVRPPGATLRAEPKPGDVVGQPWNDATRGGGR